MEFMVSSSISHKSVGIIIQARMTSTRLPGKVLLEVNNKSLLQYQIERLQLVRSPKTIVVATTTNKEDDEISTLCEHLGVQIFRGDEHNVLERFYFAARLIGATTLVRITADCPLISPWLINRALEEFFQNPSLDYLSNLTERTFPRGLDFEIFSEGSLKLAYQSAQEPAEREHVTPYIYKHPEIFNTGQFTGDTDHSEHRWTVDTIDDFNLIKNLLTGLGEKHPHYTLQDCLDLISENPGWSDYNRHVEQKTYGE